MAWAGANLGYYAVPTSSREIYPLFETIMVQSVTSPFSKRLFSVGTDRSYRQLLLATYHHSTSMA